MNMFIVKTGLGINAETCKQAALKFYEEVIASPEQLIVEVYDTDKQQKVKYKMTALNEVEEVKR